MKVNLIQRIFTGLLVLCLAGLAAAQTETNYLAILLEGKKVGHAVHTRTVHPDHVITTDSFSMTFGRGGQTLKVASQELHRETLDGKPLGFEMTLVTSGSEQKTSGTITDGKLSITKEMAGLRQELTMDWPEGALLSEGMRLYQRNRGLTAGDTFEVSMFRPDLMMAVVSRAAVKDKAKIDLFGRVLELTELKMTTDIQGQTIAMTSYVDDDLKPMKTLVPMMGITLEMVACDKNFAMREDDLIDFLEKLSVQSPTQLTNLASAKKITYDLKPAAGKTITIPETSGQTVAVENDRIFVSVKKLEFPENASFPYTGTDASIADALKPSEFIQSDNPKIIELARHAVGGTTDAAKAAQQIKSFVAGYIQLKDFSVGYASASEVAQSRQGDCSEHAVLAAAMCRAVGIPARVVCGIVYTDSFVNRKSIFGGHMWVEAFIGDVWVSLDPTRVNQDGTGQGFGPGHIALATGNGDPTDFFSLINTLGCFTIEKISVQK